MRVNHIEMQKLVYVKIQFDFVNMNLKYIMKHKWYDNVIKIKVHVLQLTCIKKANIYYHKYLYM